MVVPAKAGTHNHRRREFAMPYHVYILASRRYGTLYIGITSDLARRLEQHRSGAVSSFTRTYKVFRLVYVETFDDPVSAITREKQMKKWNRDWKIRLIEEKNPDWSDLTPLVQ
jgi:putative endonuclease